MVSWIVSMVSRLRLKTLNKINLVGRSSSFHLSQGICLLLEWETQIDPEVSDQHLEKEAKGSGETEGRPSDFFFDISCDKCLIREKPRICGTFLYHSQTVSLMQSVVSPENLAFHAPPSCPVGFKCRELLWSHTTWLCHLPALWPSLSNSSELSPL